ncbi:FMN-dependent NADH-azoreductase [Alkalicoccobacillus plakortidis]|uniref:FMN dependent NADH:quinone oxidoreductase n=1 Tax=Alkalicoccobacillus plakortidis TaxID=444060 RepID=A0ABT0XJW4_9BACI|nr:FMN-dependent NADH-azoreductase [Alkalicoccobacillus plakortidis]MCM2676179.1 FMN-dependent NADH-azoreductase [Alkalicoccobacillus plakortidis]
MSKVLFIKANDRPADQAVSVMMYDAFLASYKEANPSDTVTELDLFKADLPYYGNEAITANYKKSQGMELTSEDQTYIDLTEQYLGQFFDADKIVFATPLWNGTVPAPLVTYISYLAQAGRTFKYTAEGPVGLAGDKKVAVLAARGSDYALDFMVDGEMAVRFVNRNLALWGILEPTELIIEGHNQYPERSQEIIADGLVEVTKAAASF